MKREQLHELVYQMLETERGGIQDLYHGARVRGQRGPEEGVRGIPGADAEP